MRMATRILIAGLTKYTKWDSCANKLHASNGSAALHSRLLSHVPSVASGRTTVNCKRDLNLRQCVPVDFCFSGN